MHPTNPAPACPGRPSRTYEQWSEFLPHYCAAQITISRQKWTGRRIVTITDRPAAAKAGEAA